MCINKEKKFENYTEIYREWSSNGTEELIKIKFSNNIEFCHDDKRGYGSCDRLYDYKTDKGLDIGYAYDEYQHSVRSYDDTEKIKNLLEAQSLEKMQNLMDICGKTSDCSMFDLWSFAELKEVLSAMSEPLPLKQIYRNYDDAKDGDYLARVDLVSLYDFILDRGDVYNKRLTPHPFSKIRRASVCKDAEYIIKKLYPNEEKLIKATEFCLSLKEHRGRYLTTEEYNNIKYYNATYEARTVNDEPYLKTARISEFDIKPIGAMDIWGKLISIDPEPIN